MLPKFLDECNKYLGTLAEDDLIDFNTEYDDSLIEVESQFKTLLEVHNSSQSRNGARVKFDKIMDHINACVNDHELNLVYKSNLRKEKMKNHGL